MNRQIHFRVSEEWFKLASARAKKLGLSLSEYVRSLVAKDCEDEKMRQEHFIKNYTLGIDNYFDTLTAKEKKAIKKMVEDWDFDLDACRDTNMYDVFGPNLEVLPIDRPLSPTMEEEIDEIIKNRIKEVSKNYSKEIWVLINPDNEHYEESFAQEKIDRLSKKFGVKTISTAQTRDSGYGQERLYSVSGDPEAVKEFETELNGVLY